MTDQPFIDTRQTLVLRYEPKANVRCYDDLRPASQEVAMRHDPASGAVSVPMLTQPLKVEMAEREVRHIKGARFPVDLPPEISLSLM